MAEPRYSKADIGRRVIYTDRSGKEHHGELRDVIEGTISVDIAIDGYSRPRYYVPDDTVELVDEPTSSEA